MTFFMWLSFHSQLFTAPTGHVIVALKELGKGKIHPRKVTNARKQSSVVVLGEQRRSEDQRFEREQFIRLRGWFFALRTASAEAGSNRFCSTCSHGFKAISILQLSLPFLGSWGRLSLAGRNQWCLPGAAAPHLEVGAEPLTIIVSAIGSPKRLKKVANLQFATGRVCA